MTIDFQDNILKFCLNTKEGKKNLLLLDETCFDLPDRKLVFELTVKYLKKYETTPSKINLIEFFDKMLVKLSITPDVVDTIKKAINELYVDSFVSDTVIIREEIVKFSQRKLTKNLFKENAEKIKEAEDEFFEKLLNQMAKIVDLGKINDESHYKGKFILKDYNGLSYNIQRGEPCFLQAVNKMTAKGGFASPELIIFMGQPKSFKTGTVINLGVNYMRDGYKVYYVDTENGVAAIETRIYQCMMALKKRDMFIEENENVLGQMVNKFKYMGGDMKVDYYPAHTKSCRDVDEELTHLRDEFGWIPDIIIWDYPDLLAPEDKKITEKRLKIQAVYHDIVRLHNKWQCFGFGLSQVGRSAVNKDVINMKDFAEDFGKAANAHAAFAICRTEDELLNGIARIIPVMQRDGVVYTGTEVCYIDIMPETMTISEIINDPANMAANIKKEEFSKRAKPKITVKDITDDAPIANKLPFNTDFLKQLGDD